MVRTNSLRPEIKKLILWIFVSVSLISVTSCAREEETPSEEETHEDTHSNFVQLDSQSMELADLKIEEVSLRPLKSILEVPGKVQFDENKLAHVGSRVPGRVIEIRGNLGDEVKEGESLAVIDSTELGTAQSEYLKARASLLAQEKSFARAKKLLDGKAISLSEYQKREAEFVVMRAEFKAAKDRLYLLGLSEAEVGRVETSEIINSKIAVRAPFSGKVIERHITLGEVVEPAADLFTVADLSMLWVIADVSEKDIPLVTTELPVEIIFSAYPLEIFKGIITYIGDQIYSPTRTVRVRTEVDNSLGKLRPEMFATVKISTEGKENSLAIPESAVQRDGENAVVFVSKGATTFEKRHVIIGPEVDGFFEVLSGLEQGEVIVIRGAFTLKSELQKGEMDEHGH